jgi:hypothetical protein
VRRKKQDDRALRMRQASVSFSNPHTIKSLRLLQNKKSQLAGPRKRPLFEKSGAKTFFMLAPGCFNDRCPDSKKSFWFFFYRKRTAGSLCFQ